MTYSPWIKRKWNILQTAQQTDVINMDIKSSTDMAPSPSMTASGFWTGSERILWDESHDSTLVLMHKYVKMLNDLRSVSTCSGFCLPATEQTVSPGPAGYHHGNSWNPLQSPWQRKRKRATWRQRRRRSHSGRADSIGRRNLCHVPLRHLSDAHTPALLHLSSVITVAPRVLSFATQTQGLPSIHNELYILSEDK